MSTTPTASHLRERANTLATLARRLQRLSALDLHRFCGPGTWVGPSPQACDAALRQRRAAILLQADALLVESRRLNRAADELAARAAALQAAR